MAIIYAAPADVLAYMGAQNIPPNPPYDTAELLRLLARAQTLVDNVLRSYAFQVDVNGDPSDAVVLAALKNTVSAQVEYWISTGDEFDELGQWQQFSVEGVSMTKRGDAKEIRRQRLCDRARDEMMATSKLVPWVSVP